MVFYLLIFFTIIMKLPVFVKRKRGRGPQEGHDASCPYTREEVFLPEQLLLL
jgi:hypothetical protein